MKRALCGLLVLGWPALADEYHYAGFPIGARAAGMGGAFSALASDSTALFYNPAGLVLTHGTELSLSTSVYGVTNDSISGSRSEQPPTFMAYPSTFAVIKTPFWAKKGAADQRHRYGFTVLVTDHTKVNRQRLTAAGELQVLSLTDETTYYGAGYAYRPWKWLSLGFSAFFVMRDLVSFESRQAPSGDRDFTLSRRELSGSHYGLRFFGGALLQLGDSLTVGIGVRSPTVSLKGSLKSAEFEKLPGAVLTERTSKEGVFLDRTPLTGVLGLALRPNPHFTLSGDVTVFDGTGTYRVLQTEDFFEEVTKVPVVNFALGVEVLPFSWLPIRAGFFTDRSSRGPAPATGRLADAAVDLLAFTGSVGYELQRATIVLGVAYEWGSGPLGDARLTREEVRWWVSGSYRL